MLMFEVGEVTELDLVAEVACPLAELVEEGGWTGMFEVGCVVVEVTELDLAAEAACPLAELVEEDCHRNPLRLVEELGVGGGTLGEATEACDGAVDCRDGRALACEAVDVSSLAVDVCSLVVGRAT